MKRVTSILMATAWLALSASVTTAEYIYLNEGSGVFRFNDDGTGRTELFSGSSLSGLVLDAAAGKLYVGDASGEIQSAALNGSALTDVVSIGAHTYQPYIALALNSTDGKIFWTDQVNQHIGSANLSGPANVQTLASGIVGAQNIRGIAIDPTNEHIYWGDATAHTLNMAKADGTGATTIGSGYWDITSLVVDEAAHRLFFGENNSGTIYTSNLDGSDAHALVSGLGNIFSIALNSSGTGLYSVNYQKQVYYANLDGSGKQLLFTESNAIDGIAAYSGATPAVTPEPSSLMLFGTAAAGFVGCSWRRRRNRPQSRDETLLRSVEPTSANRRPIKEFRHASGFICDGIL